jgi:large subunit ribosomal protein L35
MPKMKSNRAAKKRFKVSASGKVKRQHAFASHIFTTKPKGRKRRLRKADLVNAADMRRVKRMLMI